MSEPHVPYRVSYTDRQAVSAALRREAERLAAPGVGRYDGPEPGLIRALIEQQEWSQAEVAHALRVDVSTLRRWCTDRAQPRTVEIPFAAWQLLLLRARVVSIDELEGLPLPADRPESRRAARTASEVHESR